MSKQVAVLDARATPPLCCADQEPITSAEADDLARAFRALGDPVRLRLLSMIASNPDGEACVCNLTAPFELSGPTISHHLRVLREAGLVTCDRRGTWVYYAAVRAKLSSISTLLNADWDADA